jgi:hypothetical protein
LARPSTIELALNVRFTDFHLWGATVDHDTDSAAVRLTERRDAKKLSEGIAHV